jgi:RNA polymerase sigma factor (sigma-70 family)
LGWWQGALSELVTARGQALKRFAFLLCGDDAEADDLVQDALVRSLSRSGRGGVTNLEGYVRRAIVNGFLDQRRARRSWLRFAPRLLAPDRVEDATADADRRGEIRSALAELPPRMRACVVLRFYEDLPAARIAELIGCREGTVRGYLSEARTRLRSSLRDDTRGVVNDGPK